MNGFFDRLLVETEAARDELLSIPFVQHGWKGELSLDSYRAFLGQAYHHVKHTTPLLMACGSRVPHDREWLRDAMAEYIKEEIGHQEWILNDIGNCGADPQTVREGTPSFATELMVSYAWDTVQRRNPAGFFGMVYVLEGTSVALATRAATTLAAALGLGDDAFSYLLSHGDLDRSHVRFLESLLDRVDSGDDRAAIVHAANRFYRLYGDLFRSLPDAAAANARPDLRCIA